MKKLNFTEKKFMDLVGLEATTIGDQTKFDLNAITTRPQSLVISSAMNSKILQSEPSSTK